MAFPSRSLTVLWLTHMCFLLLLAIWSHNEREKKSSNCHLSWLRICTLNVFMSLYIVDKLPGKCVSPLPFTSKLNTSFFPKCHKRMHAGLQLHVFAFEFSMSVSQNVQKAKKDEESLRSKWDASSHFLFLYLSIFIIIYNCTYVLSKC